MEEHGGLKFGAGFKTSTRNNDGKGEDMGVNPEIWKFVEKTKAGMDGELKTLGHHSQKVRKEGVKAEGDCG